LGCECAERIMRLVDEGNALLLVVVFCEDEGRSEQQACDEVGMRVCSMRGPQGWWLFGQGQGNE
jgi:hypothetical protein